MHFRLLNLFLIALFFSGCAGTSRLTRDQLSIVKVATLPKAIDETSGLIYFNGYFWTHNDSGGKPELYAIDPENGKIVKTIKINNAKNIDWEDLAQDEQYFYIADTGNNRGKRQEFQIYKVSKADIVNCRESIGNVKADSITFTFEHLPNNLKLHRHNYDMEALCVIDGKLMIFSKNWANNRTDLYYISDGIAQLIETYHPNGLITGGVYDRLNNRVYLIGYHRYVWFNNQSPFIYVIDHFNTDKERIKKHLLKSMKGFQTEAIEIYDNNIYFSNEYNKKGEQSLRTIHKF